MDDVPHFILNHHVCFDHMAVMTLRFAIPPIGLLALTAGAFGIGVTEFVTMGLLIDVGRDLGVSTSAAGLLTSGYALGVVVGAPILTMATARWRRKTVLIALMAIFIVGNAACAVAPTTPRSWERAW